MRWIAAAAVAVAGFGIAPTATAATERVSQQHVRFSGLGGFEPGSLSFPTSTTGYVLGYIDKNSNSSPIEPHVMARTTDGGRTWQRRTAPPVDGPDNPWIDFVSSRIGVAFGLRRTWLTTDGALHWRPLAAPGKVLDATGADGRLWLLAHTCAKHCGVALYSAPLSHPEHVTRDRAAPRFPKPDVSFVHGAGPTEIYIDREPRFERGSVWRSYNGSTWTRQHDPNHNGGCAMSAWSQAGIAAVCNVYLAGGSEEDKAAYVSWDGAHTWTRMTNPSVGGYLDDFAAGSSTDWVEADERTAFQTTTDGGTTWTGTGPSFELFDGAGQVQSTGGDTFFAVPATLPHRELVVSHDGGRTWSRIKFPKWTPQRSRGHRRHPKPTGCHRPPWTPKQHGLEGFQPTAMSFADAYTGYVAGYTDHQIFGTECVGYGASHMMAKTDDGGATWYRTSSPPVQAANYVDAMTFATPDVGLILSNHTWLTTDGSRSWHRTHLPGPGADALAADGRLWVIAPSCAKRCPYTLFSTPLNAPGHFERVRGAPTFHGAVEPTFVHGSDGVIYVYTDPDHRTGSVWQSFTGVGWSRHRAPTDGCAITAWDETGLAAVCNHILFGVGEQSKYSFVSYDGGASWIKRRHPSIFGYIGDLAADSRDDWALSFARGGIEVTSNGGRHWRYAALPAEIGDGMGEIQALTPSRFVAIPDNYPMRHVFKSYDGGQTWSVTTFPRWPLHRH